MKNTLTIIWLTICIVAKSNAQKKTEDFEIKIPDQKIANSFYKTITVLDSRADTTNFGVVQLGAFNRKARVVPKIPLTLQLQHALDSMTDSNAGHGELLLQLRQFALAEVTSSLSERGYCFFRANLYVKENDVYKKLNAIDTIITFKAADVTQKLLIRGGNALTDFLAANLNMQPGNEAYTSYALKKIDSIEKSKIKLYNTDQYVNGIYKTYTAFKNQEPTFTEISAKEEKGELSKVKIKMPNGEFEKVKSKDIYAIVFEGEPFIATEFGYYRMYKIDQDLIFTGEVKVSANPEDVMAATFMLGILGGVLASNTSDIFELKIDHVNGSFIHLRKIPRPDTNIP